MESMELNTGIRTTTDESVRGGINLLSRSLYTVSALTVIGLGISAQAVAFENINAFTGASGAITTPSAVLAKPGSFAYQYNQFMEPRFLDIHEGGNNHVFTLGVFNRLELGGRLTDFDPVGTDELENGVRRGKRDLSGNAKINLLSNSDQFWLSVGALDFGGLAQNFSSYYGVASYKYKDALLSFGAAFGDNPSFNGAFANASLNLGSNVTLISEYDTNGDFNLGVVGRINLNSHLSLNASLAQVYDDLSFGVGFHYKLGQEGSARSLLLATDVRSEVPHEDEDGRLSDSESRSINFGASLVRHGFQHVRVGNKSANTFVVQLENKIYSHSDFDAISLVKYLSEEKLTSDHVLDITLLEQGLPKYRTAFLPNSAPVSLEAYPGIKNEGNVAWLNHKDLYNRTLLDLTIEPHLITAVGTEVGIFDYSLAAKLGGSLPLWQGSQAVLKYLLPLANSDNFSDGGVFESFGAQAGVERAMIMQYLPLGRGVHTQGEFGLLNIRGFDYMATKLQATWGTSRVPFGAHATYGQYRLQSGSVQRNVWVGTISYDINRLGALVSASYGQFFYQDRGLKLKATKRFGNTNISMFVNAFDTDDLAGGLQFSIPIGPRKGKQIGRVTLSGASSWSHELQTTIKFPGAEDNRLQTGLLIEPLSDTEIPVRVLDSNRLNKSGLARWYGSSSQF